MLELVIEIFGGNPRRSGNTKNKMIDFAHDKHASKITGLRGDFLEVFGKSIHDKLVMTNVQIALGQVDHDFEGN